MVNIDNMIQLTYEEKNKNRELRHKIIDNIMEIYDRRSLEELVKMSNVYKRREYGNHIMGLDEAIGIMEIEDVRTVHKLFKDEADRLIANAQITKLCEDVIKQYDEWEGEADAGQEDSGQPAY
ncbi:MAG: hypothetical protein SOR93_06490 [Clostridiales Family XIII bacterium]|nr:hypothetical protein [Clostridia bacterium]MDY3010902.1 hypothetical protein [Clostridiales Family XIII bacterium]